MGELLLVLAVVVMLAAPIGLTVVVFLATRALVAGNGRRPRPAWACSPRYEFGDGGVEADGDGFAIVWVVSAMTAGFGAAMGLLVVGRQFSKKGVMLF